MSASQSPGQEHQFSAEDQRQEEIDLTPYEDDDDATLHRKLVAAKMARKRAEEDLKLLCNRIGLLKSEEGKAVRKIDETRKRATDIVMQRRRNMENQQIKLQRQNQQLQEQAMKTQMHFNMKEDINQKIQTNKNYAYERTKQEATETKQDKNLAQQRLQQNRREEEQRAQNIKMMIKVQQQEAQTKRQLGFQQKQYHARAQIEEKLNRELTEQQLYEMEVARMEKEELELINRLKNTKILEEQAHNQLESAIRDPIQAQKVVKRGSETKNSSVRH